MFRFQGPQSVLLFASPNKQLIHKLDLMMSGIRVSYISNFHKQTQFARVLIFRVIWKNLIIPPVS